MAVLWLSHQPQTMLAQAQHTHTQPHTRTYSSVFVCVTVGRLPCAHAIVLPFAVGKSSNFSKPQNKKHISYYKSSDPRAKKICYNPLALANPLPARIAPAVYLPCVYLICICASVSGLPYTLTLSRQRLGSSLSSKATQGNITSLSS